MSEARLWKLLRNSEAQPKFTLSYKKKRVIGQIVKKILSTLKIRKIFFSRKKLLKMEGLKNKWEIPL